MPPPVAAAEVVASPRTLVTDPLSTMVSDTFPVARVSSPTATAEPPTVAAVAPSSWAASVIRVPGALPRLRLGVRPALGRQRAVVAELQRQVDELRQAAERAQQAA